MKPGTRQNMAVMTGGSFGISILALIITLGFFEESPLNVLRNIVIANIIFLLAYWGWLKVYGHYRKMYRLGLNEEEK